MGREKVPYEEDLLYSYVGVGLKDRTKLTKTIQDWEGPKLGLK